MELLRYWRIIRKSLWLVGLLALLGAGVMSFVTLQQPAEYQSSATLLLNPASNLLPYYQTQIASNLADNYTAYMHTQAFGDKVAKALPFALSGADVVGAVTTRLKPNTLFFDITGQSSNPQQAQQLVDTVVKVFLSANADQQVQSQQSQNANTTRMQDLLNNKLSYLEDQSKAYQSQIDTLMRTADSKDRNDNLLQLRGQMVALQQSETDVIVALGQLNANTTPQNTALVVDAAAIGARVPTKLTSNALLGLIVALLAGIGLAFVRDYVDYTVRSPEHMEEVLGIAPLAVVGNIGASGKAYGEPKRRGALAAKVRPPATPDGVRRLDAGLVTLDRAKSPESESFRVLRTNIQFSSLDNPIRTLAVTSSVPYEGKSFTAANLAIVTAQAGKRVILVDGDLRRPTLHKLFALPNTIGFTSLVLSQGGNVRGVIQQVPEVPNLGIITSGPLPPNPSELLNSHRAVQIMTALAAEADLVIYDTPPAAAVTDALILATRVDAVTLVIRSSSTRRDTVSRVIKALETIGAKALIPVLNRVKLQDIQGYYYYYHNSYGSTPQLPALESNGKAAGSNGNGNGNGHRRGRRQAGAPDHAAPPVGIVDSATGPGGARRADDLLREARRGDDGPGSFSNSEPL